MNKPHGMSRKDCLNMKSIVREFLNDPSAMVEFSESHTGSQVIGFKGEDHDEGFSCRSVSVSVGDKPGTYEVSFSSWGRDCDGRHSQDDNYIVVKTSHRKRYYMSRNWETNRPQGKFGVKTQWRGSRIDGWQRDYTAESMGY